MKALAHEYVHKILEWWASCNNNCFRNIFKLLLESTNLGNVKSLSTIDNENISQRDIIEAVLEKGVGIFDKECPENPRIILEIDRMSQRQIFGLTGTF
jgi:hypothetical protein